MPGIKCYEAERDFPKLSINEILLTLLEEKLTVLLFSFCKMILQVI